MVRCKAKPTNDGVRYSRSRANHGACEPLLTPAFSALSSTIRSIHEPPSNRWFGGCRRKVFADQPKLCAGYLGRQALNLFLRYSVLVVVKQHRSLKRSRGCRARAEALAAALAHLKGSRKPGGNTITQPVVAAPMDTSLPPPPAGLHHRQSSGSLCACSLSGAHECEPEADFAPRRRAEPHPRLMSCNRRQEPQLEPTGDRSRTNQPRSWLTGTSAAGFATGGPRQVLQPSVVSPPRPGRRLMHLDLATSWYDRRFAAAPKVAALEVRGQLGYTTPQAARRAAGVAVKPGGRPGGYPTA